MADRYNPVFKGGFWTKKMPTVDSTSSTSRVDNVHDLSPPRYTVQDKIWDAAKESLPSALPERPTVIAVMGPTGIGKSTFISKLASRERMLGCKIVSV